MQGFSKIFDKIINKHKYLVASDLTPEQKMRLYDLFAKYGATQGFTYDRFFQHGFSQWEIDGIDVIKKGFLGEHEDEIIDAVESELITGRLVNMTTMYNQSGAFFAMVSLVRGLRTDLYAKMADLGMKSNTTTLARFTEDNWLPWERKGVKAILQEFEGLM